MKVPGQLLRGAIQEGADRPGRCAATFRACSVRTRTRGRWGNRATDSARVPQHNDGPAADQEPADDFAPLDSLLATRIEFLPARTTESRIPQRLRARASGMSRRLSKFGGGSSSDDYAT